MFPENRTDSDDVRTEQTPAQEKLTFADNTSPALSAEQVYAQRQAEMPSDQNPSAQSYIP